MARIAPGGIHIFATVCRCFANTGTNPSLDIHEGELVGLPGPSVRAKLPAAYHAGPETPIARRSRVKFFGDRDVTNVHVRTAASALFLHYALFRLRAFMTTWRSVLR